MMKNPLTEASVSQQDLSLCSSFQIPTSAMFWFRLGLYWKKQSETKESRKQFSPPDEAIPVFPA